MEKSIVNNQSPLGLNVKRVPFEREHHSRLVKHHDRCMVKSCSDFEGILKKVESFSML